MLYPVFFLISLTASTIGAIAGIGGGVIIKPALDAFQLMSVAVISFFSGCTVLSMSCYSVARAWLSGDAHRKTETAIPLGIGAAIGGVLGKELFKRLTAAAHAPLVGAVQSACLFLLTVTTFLFTLFTARIRTHDVRNPALTALIGLTMGVISAFLGIGGGPINLMVLSFFFSMDIKTAAQNSLTVILLSQTASLLITLITGSVPEFPLALLCLMIAGGLLGGALGQYFYRRMSASHIRVLYLCTMSVIILLSLRNMITYLH